MFIENGESLYKEIQSCRICSNSDLVPVLDLGMQYLTGVFPKSKEEKIGCGPLELVKCCGSPDSCCGLVQLRHSYRLPDLYGSNYGYRSGLNSSMVSHLKDLVYEITERVTLKKGDIILDIGSNDCTLLGFYDNKDLFLLGMDPTALKFKRFYPDRVHVVPDFFSLNNFRSVCGGKKAKIVTSISMFYDLESPIQFAEDVRSILANDGLWVFEQSYLPLMLNTTAYDTVCHEHLEYYSLRQIKWIADQTGFRIIDVSLNNINGGSFQVTAAKSDSHFVENKPFLSLLLESEDQQSINTLGIWGRFKKKVEAHRTSLRKEVEAINSRGSMLLGYGASTKGNVILQYCNLTANEIPLVAEINKDKFGCFTPGTNIPIVSEMDARTFNPDFFLVLPWHFRQSIIEREKAFLNSGGTLLFPLPEIQAVTRRML